MVLIGDYLGNRAGTGTGGNRTGKRTRKIGLIEAACGIGREYGYELRRNGTPLDDGLAAFMFFRRSPDETARQLAMSNGLSAGETVEGLVQIADLADEVLLAITDAYDLGPPRSST